MHDPIETSRQQMRRDVDLTTSPSRGCSLDLEEVIGESFDVDSLDWPADSFAPEHIDVEFVGAHHCSSFRLPRLLQPL